MPSKVSTFRRRRSCPFYVDLTEFFQKPNGSKLLALLPTMQMLFKILFRTICCRHSRVVALLNKLESYSDLNFRRHQKLNDRHL